MLSNQAVRLRAVEPDDASLMLKWRFDPNNYDCFYEYAPVSMEAQKAWIVSAAQSAGKSFDFIAEDLRTGRAFGMVALLNIDYRNRKCELGRVLVGEEDVRGTGHGLQMVGLCLEYAFAHLNMRKVWLEVFADNLRAVGFYEKLGFERDGLFKEHVFKGGVYKDVLHMSKGRL